METQSLYLRISPKEIYYLKFILEAYDGMALLSTVDAAEGLVVARYPAEWRDDLFGLLSSLAPEIKPELC